MSLKIRLARGGSKKRPFYSVVVADSRMPRDGRFIEKIGTYDPRLPKDSDQRVQIDGAKAIAWIAKGAKPTDRVGRFLSKMETEEGGQIWKWEHGNNPKKGEPGMKAKERKPKKKQRLKRLQHLLKRRLQRKPQPKHLPKSRTFPICMGPQIRGPIPNLRCLRLQTINNEHCTLNNALHTVQRHSGTLWKT